MSGYSKLHNSLLTSSIWDEPDNVRVVWITLLSMVEDSRGFVNSSLPGLAHMARKTREETIAAVIVLESPDPDSKNPDNEGRRIKRVEGGWIVLNYEIYRATKEELSVDPNTIGSRERMRRYRERKSKERNSDVTTVTDVTSAYAYGDASASASEEIYNAYPRKVGRPKALAEIGKALKKISAAELLAKTQAFALAQKGADPQFIPHPATWFHQERFNDDPSTWQRNLNGKLPVRREKIDVPITRR